LGLNKKEFLKIYAAFPERIVVSSTDYS